MEKKTKARLSFSTGEFINFITLIISVGGAILWAVLGLERRFEGIDRRLDGIDRRLNGIDAKLAGIEVEVKRTANVLNDYLTWRFLYQHDPTRKDVEPRYDPNKRVLEFYDKDPRKGK